MFMGGYSIQTGLGKKQGGPSDFSEDGFHPGAAGIARQKNALLAQSSAALGLFGENPAKRIEANGLSKKVFLKDWTTPSNCGSPKIRR